MVLYGIGGSGKTVLARKVGNTYNGNIVELMDRDENSLFSSFYSFFEALKENRILKKIEDSNKKIPQAFYEFATYLKRNTEWLVILDNLALP